MSFPPPPPASEGSGCPTDRPVPPPGCAHVDGPRPPESNAEQPLTRAPPSVGCTDSAAASGELHTPRSAVSAKSQRANVDERTRLWLELEEIGTEVARLREERRRAPESAAVREAAALRQRLQEQERELEAGASDLRGEAEVHADERQLLEQEVAALQELSDEQQREVDVLRQQLQLRRGPEADTRAALEQDIGTLRSRALQQREEQQLIAKSIDDMERGILRDRDRHQLDADTARVEGRGRESDLRYAVRAAELRKTEAQRRAVRAQTEREAADRTVATLEGDLQAVKSTLHRQSKQLGEAAAALEAAGTSRDEAAAAARAELTCAEQRLRGLQREHEEKCRQKERLIRAAAATSEELAGLERLAADLQEAERAVESQCAQLRSEAEAATDAMQTAGAALAEVEAAAGRQELPEAEKVVRSAIAEAEAQLQRVLAESEAKIAVLTADVDRLRSSVAESREAEAHSVAVSEAAREAIRSAKRREHAAQRAAARSSGAHQAAVAALRSEQELLTVIADEYAEATASPEEGEGRLRLINRLRALADDKNRQLMRRGRDLIDERRRLTRSMAALSEARAAADAEADEIREREELLRLHAQLLRRKEGDVAGLEAREAELARAEQELRLLTDDLLGQVEGVDLSQDVALIEGEIRQLEDKAAGERERADQLLQCHLGQQEVLAKLEKEAAAGRSRRVLELEANPLPGSPRKPWTARSDLMMVTDRAAAAAHTAERRQAGDDLLADGWHSLAEARRRRREEAERAAAAVAAEASARADSRMAVERRSALQASTPPREGSDHQDRLLRLRQDLAAARDQNSRISAGFG